MLPTRSCTNTPDPSVALPLPMVPRTTHNPRTAQQRFLAIAKGWMPGPEPVPTIAHVDEALALLHTIPASRVAINAVDSFVQGALWSGSTDLVDAMRAWIKTHPFANNDHDPASPTQAHHPMGVMGLNLNARRPQHVLAHWASAPYAPAGDLWVLATKLAIERHPIHRVVSFFEEQEHPSFNVVVQRYRDNMLGSLLAMDGLHLVAWDRVNAQALTTVAMKHRFLHPLPWSTHSLDALDALFIERLPGTSLDASIIQANGEGPFQAAAALSFLIQRTDHQRVLAHLHTYGSYAFDVAPGTGHATLGFFAALPRPDTLRAVVARDGQNAATRCVLDAINQRHTFR